MVLEVIPVREEPSEPLLFNAPGEVNLIAGQLEISNVSGESGTTSNLLVSLPADETVTAVSVNGQKVDFKQWGGMVSAEVCFSGFPFSHNQGLADYSPLFRGGSFTSRFRIPARIFKQLEERKENWPVTYTAEDLTATWLASDRLLLFINIADPQPEMEVTLKINDQKVEVRKAYSSVFPHAVKRTFVGFYADLSRLKADTDYTVEVVLPELKPGQFQGLFFENVEAEFTSEIKK